MMLGALADLYRNTAGVKSCLKAVSPSSEVVFDEVTRSSMDAVHAVVYPGDVPEQIGYGELCRRFEEFEVEDDIKGVLASWIRTLAEAKAFDPADVIFAGKEIMSDALAIAMSLYIISELGAKDLYSTAPMISPEGYAESDEVNYICRKHSIPTTVVSCEVGLTTASGAALLGALRPSFVRPKCVVTLDAGYGAGDEDTAELPNILRAALTEDDNTLSLEFEAESLFAESRTTYANI